MSDTEYVESIDAPVDKGMVDLVQFFVNNGFMTTNSCSGLIEDHFDNEESCASKEEIEDAEAYHYRFLQRPYLTFEPMYHHWLENDDLQVDQKYYEFKSRLSDSIPVVVRDGDDLTGVSQIDMSLTESGNPYTTTDAYHYLFEYEVKQLWELFDHIDMNFGLYDEIIKTSFELIKIVFQYPLLGSRLTMSIDKGTEEIMIGCSSLPYIPDNVNKSLFDISELEGEDVIGEYDAIGELEDIRREFFKKQSDDFFRDVRMELDREVSNLTGAD